ncbi:kin of IRRE-like protein 3 [Patiria miniata]|uniref:Ig-like domain-containing protein n=1 Tax=Patiria miniata TaxID=46514 RepID=A0A914B6I1_PATMI|nr:kin of IRRE-like protein 3 [Patiria miniata]
MTMWSPRAWFVSAVAVIVLSQETQAIFTVLPANISAIAGDTVTFRCTALSSLDTFLYWSKGNTHLSLGGKLLHSLDNDLRERYSLGGNQSIGEYDLRIENVKKTDAGDYQCSYIGSAGGRASPPATMTVYVPPLAKYPLCKVRTQSQTSETTGTMWPGDGAEFTCQSSGGDPPALLQWQRINNTILEPQPSHIVYARILLPEDNGVRFTCVATGPALREPRRCSVMPMRILPVVQVRPLTRMIIPGDNATFHCEGSAIPHVASYSWQVAGNHISDGQAGFSFANQKQLLTIHDVKQSHDQIEVACEASTPTGIAESASVKMVVTPIYVPPTLPSEGTPIDFIPSAPAGPDDTSVDEEEPGIIDGDLFMITLTIFGALVILLLVVAVVMGCWALHAKGKRPQTLKRPRVEYQESTATTIDLEPLPLPTQLAYEPPTTVSSDPMAIPAPPYTADKENAPGYISQLYSTLDSSRLPARPAFSGFPEKPVASITPTQGVASTLPRPGKIDKPCGTGKPTVKECPASFSIPEEKVTSQEDKMNEENEDRKNGN